MNLFGPSMATSDCESSVDTNQVTSEDRSGTSKVQDMFEDLSDELNLEGSVFDACILTPLWRRRRTTTIRVWFWVILSFLLQFGTGVFLYMQLDETLQPHPDFFHLGDEAPTSGCSWVAASDAANSTLFNFSAGTPSDAMVCVNKEVLQMRSFANLDKNGDGRWTYAEAQGLGDGMGQVYLHLVSLLQSTATKSKTTQCSVGEVVTAFVPWKGNTYDVRILGQQVTTGNAVIAQQVDTGEVYKVEGSLQLDLPYLVKQDDHSVRCRVAPCVDTDFGRTDGGGGPCSWYTYEGTRQGDDIPKAMSGKYDDDDFVARDMCCYLGGGSSSANNTQFQKLPINLAVQNVVEVEDYFQCQLTETKHHCLTKYSSVPADFFTEEIAPLMDLCMVQDVNLCGNVISRHAWPQERQDRMHEWILRALDNVTTPLFLQLSTSMDQISDVSPTAMCVSVLENFCPKLFPDYAMWNTKRLETCGQSSMATGKGGAVTHYEKNDLYNGPLAVRSGLVQAFLAWMVLLWALAMLPEFRKICLWWEVFLGLPVTQAGQECILRVDDGLYMLVSMPRLYRWAVGVTVLLPQTFFCGFLYILGIHYLFVVRSISDLIFNSLALTFLLTFDDMLHLAFGGAYSKHLINNLQPIKRDKTWRSGLSSCIRKLHKCHIPLGMALFLPMVLCVVGLFVKEVHQVNATGDLLQCWCEAAGDQCFVTQALRGDSLR